MYFLIAAFLPNIMMPRGFFREFVVTDDERVKSLDDLYGLGLLRRYRSKDAINQLMARSYTRFRRCSEAPRGLVPRAFRKPLID